MVNKKRPRIWGYAVVPQGECLAEVEQRLREHVQAKFPNRLLAGIFADRIAGRLPREPLNERRGGVRLLTSARPGDHVAFLPGLRAFSSVSDLWKSTDFLDRHGVSYSLVQEGLDNRDPEHQQVLGCMVTIAMWSILPEHVYEDWKRKRRKDTHAGGQGAGPELQGHQNALGTKTRPSRAGGRSRGKVPAKRGRKPGKPLKRPDSSLNGPFADLLPEIEQRLRAGEFVAGIAQNLINRLTAEKRPSRGLTAYVRRVAKAVRQGAAAP